MYIYLMNILQNLTQEILGTIFLSIVEDLLWCAFFDNDTAIHKDNTICHFISKAISWVTIAIVIPDLARSCITDRTSPTSLGQGLMLVRQTRERLDP